MIGSVSALTPEDRARISDAVRLAERQTRGEIVAMLVSRSGLYRDARHRAGFSLALLVLALLLMMETAWVPWGWHQENAAWLLLATVTAYGIGAWLGRHDAMVRLFTSSERMQQKVRLRAERAFAQHGIARTRERSGVLLMLSLLERQVYVMPDQGIRTLVPADRWQQVVDAVVQRLKEGDLPGGICAGVDRCGAILARVCPLGSGDNPDEIPDRLIEEP